MAWLLASACLLHHAVHWLGPAAPGWLHALASTPVHAAMSALALLGACCCGLRSALLLQARLALAISCRLPSQPAAAPLPRRPRPQHHC